MSLFVATSSGDENAPATPLADEITDVWWTLHTSQPPHLTVWAIGKGPHRGYSLGNLVRASYKSPPKDGIQDYYLQAPKPVAPVNDELDGELDFVIASDYWPNCTRDAPWIQGIRVHGAKNKKESPVHTR